MLLREKMKENVEWYREMANLRFVTFHVISQDCEQEEIGQVVVAVQKIEEKRFKMACAFCCPKDFVKFNRKYGQFIAASRLFHSPEDRGSVYVIEQSGEEKVVDCIKQGVRCLATHYPVYWFIKEVKDQSQLV